MSASDAAILSPMPSVAVSIGLITSVGSSTTWRRMAGGNNIAQLLETLEWHCDVLLVCIGLKWLLVLRENVISSMSTIRAAKANETV